MAFDECGKRPLPVRLEYACKQRLVAVAEILDVLHVEFAGSFVQDCGGHVGPSLCARVSHILAQTSDRDNCVRAQCRTAAARGHSFMMVSMKIAWKGCSRLRILRGVGRTEGG